MIPALAGVHHLKLPLADLDRSICWYASRLGYRVVIEFRVAGRRTAVSMTHPDGGPWLGLALDPPRPRAAAGFDYFSIGVPDREHVDDLAAHLTAFGEQHAGVHFATVGWILPMLHDPDGHEVRFYTIESHTQIDPSDPLVIDDAIASASQGSGLARRSGCGTRRAGRNGMNGVAQAAAVVAALTYIGAAPLEMFLFDRPAAQRFLHVEADNIADVRMWAFVVGFRNMLAALAIAGLVMLHTGDADTGEVLVLRACSYMLLASLAMAIADVLGHWRPRGGSVPGTVASSLPPLMALIAAA